MFRNGAKTAVLLAALGGVMVGAGSLFGRGGAIMGLILSLAVVGFSYWKRDTLAIRAARAVPADEVRMPEYFAIMRELTSKAKMPMRGVLAAALLASLAASLIQMAISRSREFEADRVGAEIAGAGEPLARALEKLDAHAARVPVNIAPAQASHFVVNPLIGRSVGLADLFRTHPTTQERVARLRGRDV